MHVFLIWNVRDKHTIIIIEDDRHKDKFSLLVPIYDILHYIYCLIYHELQFLHNNRLGPCDNSMLLVWQGIG